MKYLKSIYESIDDPLFKPIPENIWRIKRFEIGYAAISDYEISEIKDILNSSGVKSDNWKQLYCEYHIAVKDNRNISIIITINKCNDEWFYVSSQATLTVDERMAIQTNYFECDSMDGLEDLLNTILYTYKKNPASYIGLLPKWKL